MRGAATAELLRCAEPLRSVGAVDCDSNTTMVAHRGTLDCATSLSSSTADLQRRTWGMHCARALVGGFAGAASAPWLALACVHLGDRAIAPHSSAGDNSGHDRIT